MSQNQRPTKGRVVNYVTKNGSIRPAIIVEDWGGRSSRVNLQVFQDGTNDGDQGNVTWHNSVAHSESVTPDTWHWPRS